MRMLNYFKKLILKKELKDLYKQLEILENGVKEWDLEHSLYSKGYIAGQINILKYIIISLEGRKI